MGTISREQQGPYATSVGATSDARYTTKDGPAVMPLRVVVAEPQKRTSEDSEAPWNDGIAMNHMLSIVKCQCVCGCQTADSTRSLHFNPLVSRFSVAVGGNHFPRAACSSEFGHASRLRD